MVAASLAACAAREPAPGPVAATSDDRVPQSRLDAVQADLARERERTTHLKIELSRARERNDRLERKVQRMQNDLSDAEDVLVSLESGLKGLHTHADAVSALADARIVLERAARRAPWRADRIKEARAKLAEAERHIEAGYYGSAVFFTARGRRMAQDALAEARRFRDDDDTRYVRPGKANVRRGPAMDERVVAVLGRGLPVTVQERSAGWCRIVTPRGEAGWIYGDLLAKDMPKP